VGVVYKLTFGFPLLLFRISLEARAAPSCNKTHFI